MGLLSAILLLTIAFDRGFGYNLEPSLSWPGQYHFGAETIDLFTQVDKTFEIWYSDQHNRSRIDLYGGIIKKYYYAPARHGRYQPARTYSFHFETTENEVPVSKCEVMRRYWDESLCFLPDLDEFEYQGKEEHLGKEVTVWAKLINRENILKMEETLYVVEHEDGIGIPLQHIQKAYNLATGGVKSHSITNYYNYESHVKPETLEVDKEKCTTWDPYSTDLETSLKKLHPAIPSDVEPAFHSFKKHHGMTYADEEHELRKMIFHDNWKFIEDSNRKNLGYTLEINKFADRTDHELRHLAATKYSGPILGTHPFPYNSTDVDAIAKGIPKEFDLRSEGFMSPIRNQGHCGSCWAFAAAATMEGVLARANGGKVVMDLSEQSLVDCAWQYNSNGCEGSQSVDAAYEYISKNGIPTVAEYGPYLEEDGYCNIKNMSKVYNIRGYVAVTPKSENALKAAIYRHGPVTIGVQATRNMVFYKGGILYDGSCYNGRMNHAVVVVGYGLHDEQLYWVVRNSWGQDWGDDGYVLLSAKNDNCNVMTTPVYPLV